MGFSFSSRASLASWFDTTLAVALVLLLTVLAMVICRQPARRVIAGRFGLLAALLVLASRALRSHGFFSSAPGQVFGNGYSAPPWLAWLFNPHRVAPQELTARGVNWVWIESLARWLNLAGLIIGTIWVIAAACAVARLLGSSRPATYSTRKLLASLRQETDGHARLVVSNRVRAPVLVGLLRPAIVLPASFESAPEQELRLALLHELIHAKRADHRWSWLYGLVQCLWFFAPFAWWIRAQLRLDQEVLTDHQAAQRFGSAGAYATTLIRMVPTLATAARRDADGLARPASRWDVATWSGPLVLRLLMLVRHPFPLEAQAPRIWTVVAAVGALCVSLGASQLRVPISALDGSSAKHVTQGKAPPIVCRVNQVLFPARPSKTHALEPVRLLESMPASFELVFTVDCEPDALSQVRVLGRRLSAGPAEDDEPPTRHTYAVRMVRRASSMQVWVDGLAVEAAQSQPIPGALELELPAKFTISIRNLVLRSERN